jgi:hypothetical protein
VKLRPGNGSLIVSWDSVPGKTYQVCYKDALTNATWTALGSSVIATSTNTTFTNTPPGGIAQRYFNVRVL